ncbi:MAG: hypothetical protein COV70_01755 [Parcubacteria group bacterium CG11_big_fil_rev_8_21_14_0_20_39_22]|nr:MAG: hypothetical protein COV70_01755 [Parcubacteria group bacterium CG11_big_fil_rev_8_21_14_0_20_39_22]
MKSRGFTLIELLVVIAIIGMLSSIVLASLNSARAKARDARRKADLQQLVRAIEFYYDDNNAYILSDGWISNPGSVNTYLVSDYIPAMPTDPSGSNYQHWRKDYRGYSCMTSGTKDQYGFYARLENPSAEDLTTISDSFDECVKSRWGLNYKVGN